jgi:hypothetical protein
VQLPVALFDGSVRTMRPGVSPELFWAAVTPAGDHRLILLTVMDFSEVGGKPGRLKKLPDELYTDRGYDSDGIAGTTATGCGRSWLGWGSRPPSPS